MHRSYTSYNPTANKLLQKRWDEKHFDDHRRAVTGVKPEIDSTPPVTFMHLHLKLKKLQLEEERLATIERDNRILLEKMSHTMRNKGQLDNINTAVPKSLSKGRRERELVRITKENMEMLGRISNKKPAISRDGHEKDWIENKLFLSNISSFPEDWYLRNKQNNMNKNISQSNPQLNSTRSDSTGGPNETQSAIDVKSEPKSKRKVEPIVVEKAIPERKKSIKKVASPVPEPVVEPESKKSVRVESPATSVVSLEENNMSDEKEETKAEEVADEEVKDEYAEDFD